MSAEAPRPLEWVGSAKADIKRFPEAVRAVVGYTLFQAQGGLKHRSAKPLTGLGGNVLEVISRHDGDTFRAVYTVRFRTAVYVLHAFPKKGQAGHRNAGVGDRPDQAQTQSSGATLPTESWRRGVD